MVPDYSEMIDFSLMWFGAVLIDVHPYSFYKNRPWGMATRVTRFEQTRPTTNCIHYTGYTDHFQSICSFVNRALSAFTSHDLT